MTAPTQSPYSNPEENGLPHLKTHLSLLKNRRLHKADRYASSYKKVMKPDTYESPNKTSLLKTSSLLNSSRNNISPRQKSIDYLQKERMR